MKLTFRQELSLGLTVLFFILALFSVFAPIVYARNSEAVYVVKEASLSVKQVPSGSLGALPRTATKLIRPTIFEDAIKKRDARIAKAKEKARLAKIAREKAAEQKRLAQIAASKPKAVKTPVFKLQTYSGNTIWDKLAGCESSNNWSYNGPSGYDGGLQFLPSTWTNMKTGYAYAWQAPREVQIEAAKRLQATSGWGQWPACARKLGLL